MLIRFNFKNFLSFSERNIDDSGCAVSQEFSMIPGRTTLKKDHLYTEEENEFELLKFGAVYGANASGKSNFVKALDYFKKAVIGESTPLGFAESYCKARESNKDAPSYFEAEMLIGERKFAYGFEIVLSKRLITSEWLYELFPGKKDKKLFSKESLDECYVFAGELKEIKDLKVYAESINGSQSLFLSRMNRGMAIFYKRNPNAKVLQDVFNWISYTLDINYPNLPLKETSLLSSNDSLDKFSKLLQAFDTGILKIEAKPVPVEKALEHFPNDVKRSILQMKELQMQNLSLPVRIRLETNHILRSRNDIFFISVNSSGKIQAKELLFVHKFENDIGFKLLNESDGTARLFDLLEILLSNENKVFVIDELDRCLHPCLTYEFVKLFFEYTKQKQIQLIITTHESRLLDFNLLRRDEVWFINRKNDNSCDLYSLEEYNERFDKKIDKAYLEGRYGGVPVFSTVFPIEDNNA